MVRGFQTECGHICIQPFTLILPTTIQSNQSVPPFFFVLFCFLLPQYKFSFQRFVAEHKLFTSIKKTKVPTKQVREKLLKKFKGLVMKQHPKL